MKDKYYIFLIIGLLWVGFAASQTNSQITIDLSDLGVTESEWNKYVDWQKRDLIQKLIYDLPEQPFWCLDNFSEI